jgi:hypothetical protein
VDIIFNKMTTQSINPAVQYILKSRGGATLGLVGLRPPQATMFSLKKI